MRLAKLTLAAVLLTVISSTANGFEGLDGRFASNVTTSSPNSLGDIKGEFAPNVPGKSWNTIGDIKGEFVPNQYDSRPVAYENGPASSWFDMLDWLLGY